MVGIITAVILIATVLAGGAFLLLLPAVQAAREAARRSQCSNNLKQIGLAMHNYHDTYKCFPSAVLTDADGQPMRSWRIAVLPFMESSSIPDRYDQNEPWDGPNNRLLHSIPINAYQCPSDALIGDCDTSYVMISGEGSIGGEPNEVVTMADIRDGTSNTIIAMEVSGPRIHWLEPRDMSIDEAVDYIIDPAAGGYSHPHPGGVNVLMADGSVHFISRTIDPQLLVLLMTRNDGQPVNIP